MIIEATSTSLILYTSRHIFGYSSHGGSATSARKCLHEGERKKGSCKLNRNVLVNLWVQGCIVGVACQCAVWRNEQWLFLLLCGESLIYLLVSGALSSAVSDSLVFTRVRSRTKKFWYRREET